MGNARRLGRVLGLLVLASWVQVLLHAPLLPARVASHFGAGGRADGWMSRTGYLGFQAVHVTLLPGLFMLLAWLLPRLPARWVSLPHRDYWFEASRRDASYAALRGWTLGMACLLQLFLLAVGQAVFQANRVPGGARLTGLFPWALGAYLAATGLWLVRFYRRFGRPRGG